MVQAKSNTKVCIAAPNFFEPNAWMVSAYKTAVMLDRAGLDVVVLTSRTRGSKKQEKIGRIKVFRVPCFFIPDPFNYTVVPFYSLHLMKMIFREKPDVFIVSKYMFYTSLSAVWLRILGKRVIVQTDAFPGIDWFAPSRILNIFMRLYARTLGMLVLKSASLVVVLHEGLIKTAKKLRLNYMVIHNGVDMEVYSKAKPAEDILKIKGKKILVSYIGRLDEVKGYNVLLKASEKAGKNLHFLFVCGDKNPEKMKELSENHKNCTFLGFRKDIPEILAASDIYVIPSFAEGLPNTLMEAMASGKACIASGVGGVNILIEDRKNGIISKPGDWKGIGKIIDELASAPVLRKKLGNNARKKIYDDFSYSSIAKKWVRILGKRKKD